MALSKATLTPDTLFQASQQTGLDYVLRLDPDRLLSPCYTALGKTPKAPTYGGWESQQIQGHSLGHYLSALAGFYYQTGSVQAKEKLDYTVGCIKEIQREDGYFGGIPSTPFDKAFSLEFNVERFSLADWWVPWYSVHKIYAGLLDAYVFAKNEDALAIVKRMADWVINGCAKMTHEQFQRMLYCEQGGMCKVFADLYGITKEERYLAMAERFIDEEMMIPAMNRIDNLQGHHANTQIPKVIGLSRLYELTKKEKYRTGAEFFFTTVTQTRSYAIGGNSNGEHFGAPYSEVLDKCTCETCNTYNMLELAEHIFSWSHDAAVADFYENALYNHILASQDPATGAKTYFVATLPGYYKIYGSFENAFWCCTGTGMENPERYNRFVTVDDGSTIYINLYIPSTITTADGWKIQIDTSFPYEQQARIKVLARGTENRSIKARVPQWTGLREEGSDGWQVLAKEAQEGQEFTMQLPMKLYTRRAKDSSGNFSVFYGPIILAADIGTKSMPNDIVDVQTIYTNLPAEKVAPIIADISHPEQWITMSDEKTLTFTTDAKASAANESYTMRPFYDTHHTRYAVYFYSEQQKEDERAAEFEKKMSDAVDAGRQQSEIDHKGEYIHSSTGYIEEVDKSYRMINDAQGSFSYTLNADQTKRNTLVVTLYGKDKGSITISIGSTELSTITQNGDKGDALVDMSVPIPSDMANEPKIRVTFTSHEGESLKVLEIHVTH